MKSCVVVLFEPNLVNPAVALEGGKFLASEKDSQYNLSARFFRTREHPLGFDMMVYSTVYVGKSELTLEPEELVKINFDDYYKKLLPCNLKPTDEQRVGRMAQKTIKAHVDTAKFYWHMRQMLTASLNAKATASEEDRAKPLIHEVQTDLAQKDVLDALEQLQAWSGISAFAKDIAVFSMKKGNKIRVYFEDMGFEDVTED